MKEEDALADSQPKETSPMPSLFSSKETSPIQSLFSNRRLSAPASSTSGPSGLPSRRAVTPAVFCRRCIELLNDLQLPLGRVAAAILLSTAEGTEEHTPGHREQVLASPGARSVLRHVSGGAPPPLGARLPSDAKQRSTASGGKTCAS